jgi:hypothetical protein
MPRTHSIFAWLAACSIVLAPLPTCACCPAWRAGAPVRIADQQILVVWDPATRVEHFIREANFAAAPGDRQEGFGFLVPSPAVPEIAAAAGTVFEHLNERIKPRVVEVTRWRVHYSLLWRLFVLESKAAPTSRALDAAPPPMAAVEVMKTARVGGYDVAVLKASDPHALTEWLATNGFDSRPELTDWSRPYVEKGWLITAFKYATDAASIEASAVRMSFETDTPLFPYRVPTDQIDRDAPRRSLLRAFVVGPGRAEGTLGEGATARSWEVGTLVYSHPLEVNASFLTGVLPEGTAGGATNAWLTAFEDATWPSGTDDLTFAFDAAGTKFARVETHSTDREWLLPLDAFTLAGLGLFFAIRRRTSR